METLNARQKAVLSILTQSQSPVTSTQLAQKTGVSKRTLIKDIHEINAEQEIILSTKNGYVINPMRNEETSLWFSEENETAEDQILKELLSAKKAVPVKELMTLCSMSSSSLQKIISDLNQHLSSSGMHIIRRSNSVYLEGNEEKKRILMGRILHKESDEFFSDIENLNEYFPGFDVSDTADLINKVLHQSGYRVKEYYTVNFLINALVVISRNPYHKGIRQTIPDLPDHYENTVIAADIITAVEKADLILYDDYSHTVHELSRILFGFIESEQKTTAVSTLHLLSDSYINTIRTILHDTFEHYNLNINYESFLNVFAIHIHEMIGRCQGSINFVPSGVSIKETDPYVYDVAVYIARELQDSFHITIPDSEINLIAIHIGYAIEQSDNYSDKPMIAIISNNYHGIADRIIEQINMIYGQQYEIAGIWENLSDIPFTTASNAFIISTSKITHSPFSVCQVSPFFTLEDQKRISEGLANYMVIIKNREFSKLFYEYADHHSFLIRHQKMNKQEVIHELASMAVKNGDVADDFEAHVLQREELSSTAFYNKFAIPHSDKQEARRTHLYIMVNTAGIIWDDQKVYIVFLIVIDHSASKEFRKLYNIIIETLYHDTSILSNLRKINSISDFIRYLSF